MQIRKFRLGDQQALWELFHSTIHSVNKADYNAEQLWAWSPALIDHERWRERIVAIDPFVVEHEHHLIGYADIQPNGYIDHFFVHYQWQRRGVGSLLMKEIYTVAANNQIERLFSHVSMTARPFFEAWGFSVEAVQLVQVRGVDLTNLRMVKLLIAAPGIEG